MRLTPIELINETALHGGAIVSSAECSQLELAIAESSGRFAVDEDGLGFVRREQGWLESVKAIVAKAGDPNRK